MGHRNSHRDIPALPFCHLVLKGQKPLPRAYPRELKSLGEHLRKRRLDLKLLQKEVAQKLGVDEASVWNWENNRIFRLCPFRWAGKNHGEKIVNYRRLLGMTQKELSSRLGVDPTTLARWERNGGQPQKELLKRLNSTLSGSSFAGNS